MAILAGETGCREWVAGSIAAVKPRATGPARSVGTMGAASKCRVWNMVWPRLLRKLEMHEQQSNDARNGVGRICLFPHGSGVLAGGLDRGPGPSSWPAGGGAAARRPA